ncbi:MAG TPA: hypothetical protein VFD33_01845 [Bacillota bacterium]|nr:hypothetical protein [Bacillota bacterium]
MPRYGVLMLPSYNRVYFQSSIELAISELGVANKQLKQKCTDIMTEEIAGVNYLVFNTKEPLDKEDIKLLSRLSFVYALYELLADDQLRLLPVALDPDYHFSDDIVSILKYSGKTNENFTRLLVNIAWITSDSFGKERPHLLDPVCGRGTSLFQGLIYGFNTSGIEQDKTAIKQATTFFSRYLKTKRFKHTASQSKMSENKKKICDITVFETSRDKESYKAGDKMLAAFYRGDTRNAARLIKNKSVDMIVGDLPYGVKHGSNAKTGSFSRNPAGLLREALPHWYKLLKKGGSIVLSWNTYLSSKDDLAQIMQDSGFKLLSGDPYNGFAHRVDQAIIRDIIVGKK